MWATSIEKIELRKERKKPTRRLVFVSHKHELTTGFQDLLDGASSHYIGDQQS